MNSTKEKIMKAASYLFTVKKYNDVTVKQISELADVAYGTVYFHFSGGKDDVLNEIARIVLDDFYQILEIDPTIETVPDVRAIIYNQMMESFAIVDKNKVIMQVFWEAKGKSEIVYYNFKKLEDKFIQRICGDIKRNREQGLGRDVNSVLVSKALMHMVWGFVWDYTMGDENNAEDITETVVDMYINGIYKKQ